MSDKPTAIPKGRKGSPARRQLIIDGAGKLFADAGFAVSTREIADALGVTQPLLYKYFQSKDDLIHAVFSEHIEAPGFTPPKEILQETTRPLNDRVVEFYETFFAHSLTREWMRLYLHGALAGVEVARKYKSTLDTDVLKPVVMAIRADINPSEMSRRRMSDREREAALVLHGSVVMLAIRDHVYDAPAKFGSSAAIERAVRVTLPGLVAEIRSLNEGK